MKKEMLTGLALAVAALIGFGGLVLAAEGPGTEAENAVKVTVTGKNYCVEVALEKAGKAPKLGVDACRHALKVDEAKGEDGEAIAAMKGWTLHYLFSEKSAPLSADKANFGKTVVVTGTVHKNERVIEVDSFEVQAGDDIEAALDEGDELDEFAEFDYEKGGGSASVKKK